VTWLLHLHVAAWSYLGAVLDGVTSLVSSTNFAAATDTLIVFAYHTKFLVGLACLL
jgi:hypothetical protein